MFGTLSLSKFDSVSFSGACEYLNRTIEMLLFSRMIEIYCY